VTLPIFRLGPDEELFPPPALADESGIIAVGGDLSPRRLLSAYTRGIFPWYSRGQPILWHCPDPRFVLEPSKLHIPKSLKKQRTREPYQLRYDTAFPEVIKACAQSPRPGQGGTWITNEMREAYVRLHGLGYAHSAEAWDGERLVGGLYGVSLGNVFFGESMFAHAPDASKLAFATLVERLAGAGCTLIDCQQETEHLARFGAESWPRSRFLAALASAVSQESRVGKWDATLGPTRTL
jgi:leucyl/phenylalanyl-tRNA--protein transferase